MTSADTALPLVSARIGDPKMVKAQQSQSFRLDLPAVNASTRLVLRLVVSAFEPAPKSTTAFVVTIGRPGNDKSARVGYLSIFPATAFSGTRRVFPFDLTRPLSELGHPRGPVDVTIAAQVSQTGAADPAGDTITVSAVEIETAKGTGAP